MHTLLLVDTARETKTTVTEKMRGFCNVVVASDAQTALVQSDNKNPDVVVLELSLAGHSGLEFLYEFRSYSDWRNIPVIIYSTVRLEDEVLHSRSWQELGIAAYLYKPDSTLQQLHFAVEKVLP